MQINKAKHLHSTLANAFSKAKAKAGGKMAMARASSDAHSKRSSRSEPAVISSSITHVTYDEARSQKSNDLNALFSTEDNDDLEQILKNDFATFSAEEYQAEIQPLFEDLLTFLNRQDAFDSLG